jgi:hypothetical protein
MSVFACRVHGAVDREAGWIDVVRRLGNLAAVEVDLDQRRRGDFLEHHAVRVDQEMVLRAGHARRDVGKHQVIPSEQRSETVRGREIDSRFPFGR